jgi:hypothetical protein
MQGGPAFQRCLASSTDTLLVREVEAYVASNPAKGPMVAVTMRRCLICAGRKSEGNRLDELPRRNYRSAGSWYPGIS